MCGILFGVVGVLSAFVVNSACFSFDTDFPVIYHDPFGPSKVKNRLSYFGYSTVMYPGESGPDDAWIIIGAPRADGAKYNVPEAGQVVKCYIYGDCRKMDVYENKPFEDSGQLYVYKDVVYYNQLEYGWIGVTMDIDYVHKRVVVCSHRWVNRVEGMGYFFPLGACYWQYFGNNTYTTAIPLLTGPPEVHIRENRVFYYSTGQAGMSAHVVQNSQFAELLLGAPGIFNWCGSALKMTDRIQQHPPAARRGRKREIPPDSTLFEYYDINVANARSTSETYSFSLTGYAVTSGYFFGPKELFYVTSSPRQHYRGQVFIFKFRSSTEQSLDIKDSKEGEQVGEYFGAALAAGDVNNDGYDDLIIGSPQYVHTKYNEGRIYVFLGNKQGSLIKPPRGHTINGRHAGGQFGLAITFLGDIDLDGYLDVAVGAPYEDGNTGAVYIYMGGPEGLNPEHSQKIVGKEVDLSMRGFGITISKPADVDHNNYKDIAIGSYLSGQTVLFRSMIPVILQQSVTPHVTHINLKVGKFSANICISFKSDYPPKSVRVMRTIAVDEVYQRGEVENGINLQQNITLQGLEFCENIAIKIKSSKHTNIYEPFTISVSQELLVDKPARAPLKIYGDTSSSQGKGEDRFNSNWPVYDPYRTVKKHVQRVPFSLDCLRPSVCHAKLALTTKFTKVEGENHFVLGSHSSIKLQTTVENTGEHAYYSQVRLDLPKGVFFKTINTTCEEFNNSVTCFLDNPLEANKSKSLLFDLDMAEINTGKYNDDLNFNVTLLTNSENLNKNSFLVPLHLVWDADMEVKGQSDKETYLTNITRDSSDFTQSFTIQKFGYSPIEEALFEMNIPISITYKDEEITFLGVYAPRGYLDKQPIICNSSLVYVQNEVETVGDETMDAVGEEKSRKPRSTTNVEVFRGPQDNITKEQMKLEEADQLVNQTYYINCTNPDVRCAKISCNIGPFVGTTRQALASLKLRMVFHAPTLQKLYESKYIIKVSTIDVLKITRPKNFTQSGNRKDTIMVSSVFVDQNHSEQIAIWIIILAVLAGILLLALAVFGLMKVGFFKRSKKMELEALKKAETEAEFEQQTADQSMENLEYEH